MSIYRRYVSAIGLENAIRGEGAFTSLLAEPDHVVCRHPIYITVPDEDAPEPPEVPDVPHRTGGGEAVTIVTPPVMHPMRGWIVLIRWDCGEVTTYKLSRLTPIEPAKEEPRYTPRPGDRVRSAIYGDGEYVGCASDGTHVVLFDEADEHHSRAAEFRQPIHKAVTPIEPAPERTYTAEQVRAARRAEVLEVMEGWTTKEEAEEVAAEHANDLLARLEGSDD